MQYAKKAGYHMGTKYTMGIGGKWVTKDLNSYHTLFY